MTPKAMNVCTNALIINTIYISRKTYNDSDQWLVAQFHGYYNGAMYTLEKDKRTTKLDKTIVDMSHDSTLWESVHV